jgi:hypothetical protein
MLSRLKRIFLIFQNRWVGLNGRQPEAPVAQAVAIADRAIRPALG